MSSIFHQMIDLPNNHLELPTLDDYSIMPPQPPIISNKNNLQETPVISGRKKLEPLKSLEPIEHLKSLEPIEPLKSLEYIINNNYINLNNKHVFRNNKLRLTKFLKQYKSFESSETHETCEPSESLTSLGIYELF